jgi:hypothetical protein
MPGWTKPKKVLRNSPVADPVDRAEKNASDSMAASRKVMSDPRSRYSQRVRAAGKALDDMAAAGDARKTAKRYAPKAVGRMPRERGLEMTK